MAFDVYHNPNPFVQALLAFAGGQAQSDRQNQLLESQMDFSAAQQSARSLSQGLGQFSGYLFNRDLQGRQIAGQSALEQLRQNAQNQRQQAAIEQQQIGRFGDTLPNIQRRHPDMSPGDAAMIEQIDRGFAGIGYTNQPVQGGAPMQAPPIGGGMGAMQGQPLQQMQQSAQQFSGMMEQTMKAAGLETAFQPHTLTDIARIQNGVSRAVADPTLSAAQKAAVIDKATQNLQMVARPSLGPRQSPPSIPELAQQGRMMMLPGKDNLLYFDEKGAPHSVATYPEPVKFNSPEELGKYIGANTFYDDRTGSLLGVNPKTGQTYKVADGNSAGINWEREYRNAESEIDRRNKQAIESSPIGTLDPRIESQLIQPTDENIRRVAMENIQGRMQLQQGWESGRNKSKVQATQEKLNNGIIPDASEWLKGEQYTIYDPDGNPHRVRVVGFQNGEPLIEEE